MDDTSQGDFLEVVSERGYGFVPVSALNGWKGLDELEDGSPTQLGTAVSHRDLRSVLSGRFSGRLVSVTLHRDASVLSLACHAWDASRPKPDKPRSTLPKGTPRGFMPPKSLISAQMKPRKPSPPGTTDA